MLSNAPMDHKQSASNGMRKASKQTRLTSITRNAKPLSRLSSSNAKLAIRQKVDPSVRALKASVRNLACCPKMTLQLTESSLPIAKQLSSDPRQPELVNVWFSSRTPYLMMIRLHHPQLLRQERVEFLSPRLIKTISKTETRWKSSLHS
jgi:hypothetical protein